MIRFRPFSVRDPQLNNREALRLLVPADWRVEGGIVWRHDCAILFDPKGSEELNLLPIEQFAQSNPGYGFGIGSNYLGSELQPAMEPQTFVSRIVMPRYRRQVGSATAVGGGELPAVAQAAQTPGMVSQIRAGRFRFSYALAGTPMEVDVYCVLSYTSVPQSRLYIGHRRISTRSAPSAASSIRRPSSCKPLPLPSGSTCNGTTPICRCGRCGKRM